MSSPGNLVTVARTTVLELPERYPGYREHLVGKLTEVIGSQATGSGKIVRRKEIRRVLEAFAHQVAAHLEESET